MNGVPIEGTINCIQTLFDLSYDDLHVNHAAVASLVDSFEIWIPPPSILTGRIRDDLSGGNQERFWTDTSYHPDDSDCEKDLNCNGNVDAMDVTVLLGDVGRNQFTNTLPLQ